MEQEARNIRLEAKEEEDRKRRREDELVIEERKKKREKKDQNDSEKEQARLSALTQLVAEGWRVVESVELQAAAQQTQNAKVCSRVITKAIRSDILLTFLAVVPKQIWTHLADHTNQQMTRKKSNNKVSNSYHQRVKQVTGGDILHAIGLRLLFSERSGLKTVKKQFSQGHEDVKPLPLSHKKYSAVMSALNCDWEVFLPLIRNNWQRCMLPTENVVVGG